jgi:hypothetical protein
MKVPSKSGLYARCPDPRPGEDGVKGVSKMIGVAWPTEWVTQSDGMLVAVIGFLALVLIGVLYIVAVERARRRVSPPSELKKPDELPRAA